MARTFFIVEPSANGLRLLQPLHPSEFLLEDVESVPFPRLHEKLRRYGIDLRILRTLHNDPDRFNTLFP